MSKVVITIETEDPTARTVVNIVRRSLGKHDPEKPLEGKGKIGEVAFHVPPSNLGADSSKIREWALANGYKVGKRGRVSKTLREAFANA